MPEVNWKESSADTGLARPWRTMRSVGEKPSAMSDWMTSAVESGSVLPGVATVFG